MIVCARRDRTILNSAAGNFCGRVSHKSAVAADETQAGFIQSQQIAGDSYRARRPATESSRPQTWSLMIAERGSSSPTRSSRPKSSRPATVGTTSPAYSVASSKSRSQHFAGRITTRARVIESVAFKLTQKTPEVRLIDVGSRRAERPACFQNPTAAPHRSSDESSSRVASRFSAPIRR